VRKEEVDCFFKKNKLKKSGRRAEEKQKIVEAEKTSSRQKKK
jgi:hypothetical protein